MIYELLLAPIVATAVYKLQDMLRFVFFLWLDFTPLLEYHYFDAYTNINHRHRVILWLLERKNRGVSFFRGGVIICTGTNGNYTNFNIICLPGALDRHARLGWFYDDPKNADKVLNRNSVGYFREDAVTIVPTATQRAVMAAIGKTFREKGNCVAILSGPPGTGKSAMHNFLVKEYRAFGSKLKKLDYNQIMFAQATPVVYLIEEFDAQLFTMMKALDPAFRFKVELAELQNRDNPFPSKQYWNALLDEINAGMYGNIIVLLTTNVDLRSGEMGSCDESLLRAGRVDHRFVFNDPVGVCAVSK